MPVDAAKINTPGKFGRISWESLETWLIVSEWNEFVKRGNGFDFTKYNRTQNIHIFISVLTIGQRELSDNFLFGFMRVIRVS